MIEIILCDDLKCFREAVARASVVTRRGRVVRACNVCADHLEQLRAATREAGGERTYLLRERNLRGE